MATLSGAVYCSVYDVERTLGLTSGYFTASTTPTDSDVSLTIMDMQDKIDEDTQNAWRLRTASDGQYEYYNPSKLGIRRGAWFGWLGYPVFLKHRRVKTLSVADGDSMQIFDGSAFQEWIGNKSEGVNGDYWVDYDTGIVFFHTYFVFLDLRNFSMRIRYRYGNVNTIPRDIKNACRYLVAAELITVNDKLFILPEGGTSVLNAAQKIEKWEKDAQLIIENRTEFVAGGG